MKKFTLILLCFTLQIFAKDVFLVKATNDEDGLTTNLYLELDESGDILKFKKKTVDQNNLVLALTAFEIDGTKAEIVLDEREGREILKLSSENFSGHQGADVSLVYLFNGITGSFKNFNMSLDRNGDDWELTSEGRKITHLHLVSNKNILSEPLALNILKSLNKFDNAKASRKRGFRLAFRRFASFGAKGFLRTL